jgi:hypothetical protein
MQWLLGLGALVVQLLLQAETHPHLLELDFQYQQLAAVGAALLFPAIPAL